MRDPRAVAVLGVKSPFDCGDGSSTLAGSPFYVIIPVYLFALFSLIVSFRMFFCMASKSLTANAVRI